MKNKLFKLTLGAIALGYGSLFAEEAASTFNPYVEVKGGIMKPGKKDDVNYKVGGTGSVEFGVSYDAWRFGLELSYKQSKIKEFKRDVAGVLTKDESWKKWKAMAGMFNVYYDYALTEEFSLYAGLGLGMASVKYAYENAGAAAGGIAPAANVGKKAELGKNVFAWQLMAGVSYDINENWVLSAGYRLFNTAKVSVSETYTGAATSTEIKKKSPFVHSVELGLRYSF